MVASLPLLSLAASSREPRAFGQSLHAAWRDFGFVLGIGLVLAYFGSMDYAEVFKAAPSLEDKTLNLLGTADLKFLLDLAGECRLEVRRDAMLAVSGNLGYSCHNPHSLEKVKS